MNNPNKIEGVKERRIETLIKRYGKIFNYDRKDVIEKDALIEMHHGKKMTLNEIGSKLNVSEAVVSYWMKKHAITVNKKIVSPKSKEYIKPYDIVKEYLTVCSENNKVLSFYEYGNITEDKRKGRLKRLFNSGKKYHHLKEELQSVILKPELWEEFLKQII